MALQSPPEKFAYLALINRAKDGRPDAIGVVPDPRPRKIVKVIEPETVARRTGYAGPHTRDPRG